jgi:ribosome-binding factor A
MVDHARARKMADRIKEIVARKLDRGIKDPRLGFVTVTDVRVTGDLQHASIFYTVYGTDEERADTARLTPSLEFILDGVPENAAAIDALLEEARRRDADVQAQAKAGVYAGDEDPYVKPRVIGEDEDDDADDEDGDDVDRSAPGYEPAH